MSFPAALKPVARSAYRSVLRAARVTFEGDPMRRAALETSVRATFSSPTLTAPGPSRPRAPPEPTSCSSGPVPAESELEGSHEPSVDLTSEAELQKRIDEWREVALFLRRNVVQGVKDDTGAYRLRVTPDTELGDNTSIRNPPKLPTTPFPNRNRGRRTSPPPETTAATSQAAQTA